MDLQTNLFGETYDYEKVFGMADEPVTVPELKYDPSIVSFNVSFTYEANLSVKELYPNGVPDEIPSESDIYEILRKLNERDLDLDCELTVTKNEDGWSS